MTTPEGFKEAYKAYRAEGGWMASRRPNIGGQGLPAVLNAAMQEFASGANLAFAMYPGLTQGAIAALLRARHARSRRRPTCRRWSPANGPAP